MIKDRSAAYGTSRGRFVNGVWLFQGALNEKDKRAAYTSTRITTKLLSVVGTCCIDIGILIKSGKKKGSRSFSCKDINKRLNNLRVFRKDASELPGVWFEIDITFSWFYKFFQSSECKFLSDVVFSILIQLGFCLPFLFLLELILTQTWFFSTWPYHVSCSFWISVGVHLLLSSSEDRV